MPPVIFIDEKKDPKQEIDEIIKDLPLPGGNTAENLNLKDALSKQLYTYIFTKLAEGDGENREGLKIARITDPVRPRPDTGGDVDKPIVIPGSAPIVMSDPKALKSSWNGVRDGNLKQAGRVGYSVKYISFKSIREHSNSTNGSDRWSNSIDPDAEAQADLPVIQH